MRHPCQAARLPLFALALVLALAFSVPAAGAEAGSSKFKQALIKQIGRRLENRAYAHGVDFTRWSVHAEKHRAAIEAAATEHQLGNALTGALAEFGVSHLWIWTPEDMRLRREGKQGGMGVKSVPVDGGRLVTMVLPDSAAKAAGLQKGDVLLNVDGKPVRTRSLSGSTGESRHVSWRRGDEIMEASLVLSGARRAAQPTLRWLNRDLAWITVPTFSFGVYEEAHISELFENAAHAKAMVLDLRSNGGGRSTNVEHLLAQVLPPATEIHFETYREDLVAFVKKHRRQPESVTELVRANGQTVRSRSDVTENPFLGPLAVIVDGRSGSGGDVFPAVIQDTKRGIVVGTPTAGKVLAGDDHTLSRGFVLFYPQGETIRLSGAQIEGNPVQPDILLTAEQTVDDGFLEDLLARRLLQ